jgi:phosphoribosylformylglycinamidine synthase
LQVEALQHKAASSGIPVSILGEVTASQVIVNKQSWGGIQEWKEKYDTAIEKLLSVSVV